MLLLIGSIIIVRSAYKAFECSDLRKALQYQALSLTGYILLGLGLGTNIGVASAIFHVINIALFQFSHV